MFDYRWPHKVGELQVDDERVIFVWSGSGVPIRVRIASVAGTISLKMPDNSFDLVSKIEMPEVSNAVQQALKEIGQRFDLKDSHSNIDLNEKDLKIVLTSQDEFKLRAVNEILSSKLVKRKVPLKGLVYGEIAPAAGSSVRQEITLQQGIPIEKARDIVKKIKDSKLKVQASINGDLIRVSGKDRDTLQQAIALLRGADFGLDLQFTNYRTN
jgi:cyclic-di-GMP-binding protein